MPSPPPRFRTRRNSSPVPVPRTAPDAGEPPAGSAEATAGVPQPPHRRRVRMLVDVVDHPDEVAYVTALFEERGWSVRPAEAAEAAPRAENRAALVVEVRLHGARLGAVRTAAAELELLARQAELGAWVRDAALVEHERARRTTYCVHRAGPVDGRLRPALARLWTWFGGADEQRAVMVPTGPGSRQAAEAELTARDLGGWAYDPARHGLRVPADSDANPPLDRTPQERRVHRAWLVAGAVGIVLAVGCGMHVVWADGWWKVPPALLSTAGAVPLGRMAKETRDRGRPAQWAAGLAGTTALAAFGALVGQSVPPRGLWAGTLLLVLAAFVGTGVVLALRRTFLTRHAAWLVPLSLPVVGSLVSWLGGQMHNEYLDRFGIRAATVPTPTLSAYLAAAQPMALALGSVLFFVALVGWLRHFHIMGRGGGFRLYAAVVATLLAVAYSVTAVALGTARAGRAADQAARTTAQHALPSAYYGLRGRLVCVRPLDPDAPVPVENGPVVTGHPVLSFGSTGEWIWLWDPARYREDVPEAFAVRREDVQLLPTKNPAPRHCPAP